MAGCRQCSETIIAVQAPGVRLQLRLHARAREETGDADRDQARERERKLDGHVVQERGRFFEMKTAHGQCRAVTRKRKHFVRFGLVWLKPPTQLRAALLTGSRNPEQKKSTALEAGEPSERFGLLPYLLPTSYRAAEDVKCDQHHRQDSPCSPRVGG